MTVTNIAGHLKPRCVGRFIVDMPDDAMTAGTTDIQGVTIETEAMTQKEHREAMAARSAELRATKSFFGYKFLYADETYEEIGGARYFVSLGDAQATPDSKRVIEAYKWDRGYQIKLQMRASDARASVDFKDDPDTRDADYMNDLADKAQTVVSILSRVRGRANDDIPTEPGVCFAGGFLPGRATAQEKISQGFALKDMHDVSFSIATFSNISETNTLLQRTDFNKAIDASDGRTLRKGQVALPGIQQAEEWLSNGMTDAKVRGHYFVLEANSKIGSAQSPLLTLDMDNGGLLPGVDGDRKVTQASLTEGEAVALWDALSRSLRPRPNAF